VLILHKPGPKQKQLCVEQASVADHLAHDDVVLNPNGCF